MSRVMSGEVTPRCQRAQRAAKIASRYPLTAADILEREEARVQRFRYQPPARRIVRQLPESDFPSEPQSQRGLDERDRQVLLDVVFGNAAPQAAQAIDFLGTPIGQRLLGVAGVTLFGLAVMG
jgi:hypothetical protein